MKYQADRFKYNHINICIKYRCSKLPNTKIETLCFLKRHDQVLSCLQDTHFKYKDTIRLKEKGWVKIDVQYYYQLKESWSSYVHQNAYSLKDSVVKKIFFLNRQATH